MGRGLPWCERVQTYARAVNKERYDEAGKLILRFIQKYKSVIRISM